MASTNLELVGSIFAARERGDYSTAEWAHPEIEYEIADGPSPGTFTGLRGLAEATRTPKFEAAVFSFTAKTCSGPASTVAGTPSGYRYVLTAVRPFRESPE